MLSSQADDPQKEILEPALNGTRNLLSSAVKSKDTIKRVVVTSTIVGAIVRCTRRLC